MSVFNRLKQVASVSTIALCISAAAINQATAAERYTVSGVESWDTLNIRSEPSARSTIIGEIPSNGKNVNSTGVERQNGRTTWVQVRWNGVSGWVSKRYLAVDYSTPAAAPAPAPAPSYIPTPDYSTQGSARTGSIYDPGTGSVFDSNTGTVRTQSVYVGPGNGLPAITPKQRTVVQASTNSANTHTHPANPCTRSVSHTHPNGANQHTHRYSCQGQATQQRPQVQVRAVATTTQSANTHTHPRNQFTNAVTHTHPNGANQHTHNYGGQRSTVQRTQVQVQTTTQNSANTHTHPRNQFTNAVTHTHANGANQHTHNYGGQRATQTQGTTVQRTQVQPRTTQAASYSHTHPRNQFSNAVTHSHPGGAGVHQHNYGGQRTAQVTQTRQAVTQTTNTGLQQVTHIHPASPYNKQTQHTHPGGAGIHIHDFLMPPRQATQTVQATRQVSANTHTHPRNGLTNSVTHTHPNGANQHTHNYGR